MDTIREKKSTTVLDVPHKKRRILITNEDTARKYISVDFCSQVDKHLVTASGGSEARIIVWNFDKQKCIAVGDLYPKPGQTVSQVSFAPNDPNVIVCTGNDLYRYFRLDNNALKQQTVAIYKRDKDAHFSNNYTCHKWLPEGKLIICTDHGQIMLLEASGEYKNIFISDTRKDPFPIWAVTSYTGLPQSSQAASAAAAQSGAAGAKSNVSISKSGFIIAGESGMMRTFVKSDADPRKPYVRVEGDDLFPNSEHY